MNDLPQPVRMLVDELVTIRGVVAVVLGGSRADGSNDARSDWDLGLYYRDALDLTTLSARGDVYPPPTKTFHPFTNGRCWRIVRAVSFCQP